MSGPAQQVTCKSFDRGQSIGTRVLGITAGHKGNTLAPFGLRLRAVKDVDVTIPASGNAQSDDLLGAFAPLDGAVQLQTLTSATAARRVQQEMRKLVLVTLSMGLVNRLASLWQKLCYAKTLPFLDAIPSLCRRSSLYSPSNRKLLPI